MNNGRDLETGFRLQRNDVVGVPRTSNRSIGRKQAPRILFVAEAVSLSHVARPAVLARWAKDAGYDVHFACAAAYAHIARGEGLHPLPIETIPKERFYGRLRAGRFFYTTEELEGYVRAERDLIERVKPDLIAGDFRLTLEISAKTSGVPWLSLQNAHWSPAFACRFPAPCSGFFKLLPLRLRERLFDLVRPIAFRVFAAPLERVRRAHGLPPLNDFRKHYTAGNFCAYLDLPELHAFGRSLPQGHFFLGPVPWKPTTTSSEFRVPGSGLTTNRELRTTNPVVYVTLGSSGEARILPDVLRALAERDSEIVLTGVSPSDADSLRKMAPGLAGRLHSAPFLDPGEVLSRAALTVCHGGSGTVYQSLAAGVPLLCLPSNPDQGLVAAAVARTGAGRSLPPERAAGRPLRSALEALLGETRYGERARALARALAQRDTRGRWLEFLASALPRTDAELLSRTSREPNARALSEVAS